jgi:uncharacterized protein YjbI with pentapeptide repeats
MYAFEQMCVKMLAIGVRANFVQANAEQANVVQANVSSANIVRKVARANVIEPTYNK